MKDTDNKISEPTAFLNLGNIFLKLLNGATVPIELLETVNNDYMNISMNVKNCEEGLKSSMHITTLQIKYDHSSEKWANSQIFISLLNFHAEIWIFPRKRKHLEASLNQLDISRDLQETLDKYSTFMMIQNDFSNLSLCGAMILKNIGPTILKELPSLLELKSIMDNISINLSMFVERVNYSFTELLRPNIT